MSDDPGGTVRSSHTCLPNEHHHHIFLSSLCHFTWVKWKVGDPASPSPPGVGFECNACHANVHHHHRGAEDGDDDVEEDGVKKNYDDMIIRTMVMMEMTCQPLLLNSVNPSRLPRWPYLPQPSPNLVMIMVGMMMMMTIIKVMMMMMIIKMDEPTSSWTVSIGAADLPPPHNLLWRKHQWWSWFQF